ncbi:hypothetical protein L207DRAFT_582721 [Hyaloscypha variabilis F]|uniref:Uncharacterized protein n=1 Tax=Hyaloscypha variabilis (strain UAMH 11265 / GT02V1 / F) TaxID=1149755 RepID=A0A2J6RPU2_HYAVF|nr:hypothetical protein L207DRAFT_582721 [Hyaloscypha variabilis F]
MEDSNAVVGEDNVYISWPLTSMLHTSWLFPQHFLSKFSRIQHTKLLAILKQTLLDMASTSQQYASKGHEGGPANSETGDNPAAQASLMLEAELKRAAEREQQALENYETVHNVHEKCKLEHFNHLLRWDREAEVSQADILRVIQALNMLSFDLHRSSEKLKRALEDYEAIKKEKVKREREAREVVSKLNGDLDSISEGSIEQTTSSVQPSTITVSLQSQEEAAEGEDPKQEPWEQVIDALEQARKLQITPDRSTNTMLDWYDECKIRASRNDPVIKTEREEYTREYQAAIANHKRHDRHPIGEYCYCLDEFKRNPFALVVN